MNRVARIRPSPERAQVLVRRRLLAEAADLVEAAAVSIRDLQGRLDGSEDCARMDFTQLSTVRARASSLASASGELSERPFGREHTSGTEDNHAGL